MDPFAIVLLAVLVVAAVCAWAVGRGDHGGGSEQLGLRPARQIVEERDALDSEDLSQLLAATNARRRARGLPSRTVDDASAEFGRGDPPPRRSPSV